MEGDKGPARKESHNVVLWRPGLSIEDTGGKTGFEKLCSNGLGSSSNLVVRGNVAYVGGKEDGEGFPEAVVVVVIVEEVVSEGAKKTVVSII